MNRYLKISIYILVLIAALFLVFRERNPFGGRNSSFGIDEQSDITRIELSDEENRLVLQKDDGKWLVNGKNEARKSSILFITRILKEVKIKSPVSPEKFNEEIISREVRPVRVKVYRNSKLLKSYFVYKINSNPYGNIMKLGQWSKPFIVYVPGFDGNIGSAFSLNPLYWQPFMIFSHMPSEIASVSLENISDSSQSFTIKNQEQNLSLSGNGAELKGWDTVLVKRYLTYFTWIPFESWAFDLPETEKKKIESSVPASRITLVTTSRDKVVLTLWEKMTDSSGVKIADTDRLWGKTNHNDELIILRYFDIDPILKRRSWFFPEKY